MASVIPDPEKIVAVVLVPVIAVPCVQRLPLVPVAHVGPTTCHKSICLVDIVSPHSFHILQLNDRSGF